MKTTAVVACMAAIITFYLPSAMAGEREITGALIGAGTGAVIGHVIGGNTESALVGSAIGSIVGMAAGHGRVSRHPREYYDAPRHHYYSRKKDHRRYSTHGIRSCRIEKYITYKHGRKYIVKESVCRGDSPSRYQQPYGNWGYNHRGYGDWRSKQRNWRR
ncbi:MAG TPA: glycine zipper family protein [Desulfopila sp.]|nr:glycine zipper family protein [Desulfopila sp.]